MFSADDLSVQPIERAETIPAGWYTERHIFDVEIESVFAQTWQLVGRAEEVLRPGTVKHIDVAGNPVLLVRDLDGTLRAFYAVCRHRGGPLRILRTSTSVSACRKDFSRLDTTGGGSQSSARRVFGIFSRC